MPILDKTNLGDLERYKNFTRQSSYGKFSQDLNWEIVKEKWESDYVYLEKDGQITAAMSVLSIKAVDDRYFMYANRGPVSNFQDVFTTMQLIEELEPIIEKRKPFLLRIDPEYPYDKTLLDSYRKKGNGKILFRSRETDIHAFVQPRYNMVLHLNDKSEEEILTEFNSKTRYNIRLSERKGIITVGGGKEYLDIFFDLTEIMSERQGITHRPKDYFERLLTAYPDSRIYVSQFENEPLSAAIAIPYGEKLFYLYGASSNEKRNMMPNHHMQWEMIKWGLQMGKKYYDFGGVFSMSNEDGLYRFKNGFCHKTGPTEWIGELDVVFDTEVYEKFNKRR